MSVHSLHITPTLSELSKLYKLGKQASLPDSVLLALEEAVVNVINYSGASDIQVDCATDSNEIRITITDDGAPFDPTIYTPGQNDNDELTIGGNGIRLIKTMIDKTIYQRNNNKNILTLIKSNNGFSI